MATGNQSAFTNGIRAAKTMAIIKAADNNLSKNGAFFGVIKKYLGKTLPA
jgi:hypothetical protein